MENQNDIRGLLQEKFQHHEATPPRDIWAQIEADVNPSQKKKVLWWPYMAVAASAIILFGLWALLGPNSNSSLPNNGMTEKTPTENVLPQLQEETLTPAKENNNYASQEETESDVRPADIQPLYQKASRQKIAQQEMAPKLESPQQEEVQKETINSSPIALNPISPINPQLYPDAPVHQLQEEVPEVIKSTNTQSNAVADNSRKLQKVKDNKLDLNEFSLENVVAFASNELSKIAGSPLDYEHQEGENAERKRYEIELGDFKITRTSFRKTTKQ